MCTRTTRRALACLLLPAAGVLQTAQAQVTWGDVLGYRPPAESPVYGRERLAKTKPDECFAGIGVDYPPLNADGSCSAGTPKANQAYVWGLTQAGLNDASFSGDEIWFGTMANPLCDAAAGIVTPEPDLTVSWVCEYGQSMLARRPVAPVPAAAGDWRPPHAYSYRLSTHQLTERTPKDPNFKIITGLRSAGSVGNMVFMAGPTLQAEVVFAAWNAADGSYKGSCRATALKNIRSWTTLNGVLYAGAGRRPGDGVILRWRGNSEQPFNGASSPSEYCGFEVVGVLPDLPAYITSYDGQRLAASVWSDSQRESATALPMGLPGGVYSAGIYLGPLLGADGQYTARDAKARWQKIWSPTDYETDPVVAGVIGGGAIAFWKGWLWFGTIHNTFGAYQAHTSCTMPACFGPPQNSDEQINVLFTVSRSASLWRARLVEDGSAQVELLYGETELPAFVPGTRTFEMKPTGWVPRHGGAGMGNPFLNYAWSASASADDLLFGFYDYRYVFDVQLGVPTGPAPGTIDPKRGYGADLWRFTDPEAAARPEVTQGLGNFSNYGVRNMLRYNGGADLILGTANAMNLEPAGGWELFMLKAPAPLKGLAAVQRR
jgi:hypothetical protein